MTTFNDIYNNALGYRNDFSELNQLVLQLSSEKEKEETFDKSAILSLHEQIRSVVASIDSRYPMRLFAESVSISKTIIQDIENDQGHKNFLYHSLELVEKTNDAINKFNNKYWQISGKRWERIGRNRHGYKTVVATHPKINEII